MKGVVITGHALYVQYRLPMVLLLFLVLAVKFVRFQILQSYYIQSISFYSVCVCWYIHSYTTGYSVVCI